jgi:hypothetical protein
MNGGCWTYLKQLATGEIIGRERPTAAIVEGHVEKMAQPSFIKRAFWRWRWLLELLIYANKLNGGWS